MEAIEDNLYTKTACYHCKGTYSKANLARHVKGCPKNYKLKYPNVMNKHKWPLKGK